jgi:phenylacetate-CoA ligase
MAFDVLAPIIRHAVAPAWARWEGSAYLTHYQRLLLTQYDDPQAITQSQNRQLLAQAQHAVRTVEFWKQRIDAARIAATEVDNAQALRRLPVLTKQELRLQGDNLISTDFRRQDLIKHTTSGSTGVSLATYRDEACQQLKRAATLRADEWSGWRLGEPVACVWGNPQIRTDWRGRLRNRLLERRFLHLDTLKMSPTTMSAFVDQWLQSPPSMLFGHAHSLYLLAQYITQQRVDAVLRPRGIISTCMVLHQFERETIERTFQCGVTNRYGCEEVSLIASQCEERGGLHVNSDCLLLEILDSDGNPCAPGEVGRVVVTDLTNRAMPLFRYEVGDMAAWAAEPCPCGRTLPLLEKIEGRVADYVVTQSGEFISGISLTENFALQIPGVVQMQIIQESVDRFVYNVVKDGNFGEQSVRRIAELTRERFGPGVAFETCFVERIAPELSGKYRFCISKVEKRFD